MMTPKQRRRKLAMAIRLTWTSLDSHLDHAVKAKKSEISCSGDERFHAEAAREYADSIQVMARELQHLTDPATIKFFRKAARLERANKQKEQ